MPLADFQTDFPMVNLMENYWEWNPHHVDAAEWLAPRDGGPLCDSHYGPLIHYYLETVNEWLPIAWESLKPDIIHVLLNHSDCDGSTSTVAYRPICWCVDGP